MIRKLLEKNKNFIISFKTEFDGKNEIIVLNICILLAIIFLIFSPILLLLIIINYIYKLYNKLFPFDNIKLFNKNLLSYEKKLNKIGTYSLKSYRHENSLTFQDFIYNLLREYSFYFITIDKNNKFICEKGRRRSLGDIYLITKHYYPDITLETVLKELLYLVKGNIISVQKCSNIGRHVYTYGRGYNGKSKISEFTSLTFKQIEEIYD